MKLKILGLAAGAALLALGSTQASAHSDVRIGVSLGIPAPVVVDYGYYNAPVYYYRDYERPRHVVRDYRDHGHRYVKHKHRHGHGHKHRPRHWR